MPVFPKPKFPFDYSVPDEIGRLRAHKAARSIPAHHSDRLLVATWNVANLGAQARRDQDLSLIAEIISWFDLIAVQECREDFSDLRTIHSKLPPSYEVLMSDASGNNERMVFVYNRRRLKVLDEIGEIAYPPSKYQSIKLPGVPLKFDGFDRTPYLALFSTAGAPYRVRQCPPVLRQFTQGLRQPPRAGNLRRRQVGQPAQAQQNLRSPGVGGPGGFQHAQE